MKKYFPVIAVVLILALVVGICVGSYYLPVMTADCIVRVSYTGFAQLFNEPFVYYAICGTEAVRVSEKVVEQLAPKAISGSKYGDVSTAQWFERLIYVSHVKYFDYKDFLWRNDPWLATEFGEKYRVYYDHHAGGERMPNEKEQAVMLQAAQSMHSGDIDDWSSGGSMERTLTWFILISNGEQMMLQHKEEALYRPMEDGTFELLMECPVGGQFDYFWFPE